MTILDRQWHVRLVWHSMVIYPMVECRENENEVLQGWDQSADPFKVMSFC